MPVTHSQESCTMNLCKFLYKKLASNLDASFFYKKLRKDKKQRQTTQTTKQQIVNSQQISQQIIFLNFGQVSASLLRRIELCSI